MHDSPFILWDSHFLNTHIHQTRHTLGAHAVARINTSINTLHRRSRWSEHAAFSFRAEPTTSVPYTLFLLSSGSDQGQIGKFWMHMHQQMHARRETKSRLWNAPAARRWLFLSHCPAFCGRWLTNGLKTRCTQIMWQRPHMVFVLKWIIFFWWSISIHHENVKKIIPLQVVHLE